MAANDTERIAVALSIGRSLIASIESLPRTNPNLTRFKIVFTDDSRLYINEDWRGDILFAYSYYWVDPADHLIIGWDSSTHHPRLPNFPHHKHVGQQDRREPSDETSLEQVLNVIRARLRASR